MAPDNDNTTDVTWLRGQLDANEQWRQIAARADRRRWLILVDGVLLLGLILYLTGVLWPT